MATEPLLEPIRTTLFREPQARHLLRRAGFGGSNREVGELVRLGLDQAVGLLVDYQESADDAVAFDVDPDIIQPHSREERMRFRQVHHSGDKEAIQELQQMQRARQQKRRRADHEQFYRLQKWWLARIIDTARPMQEKLVLLWHGHFASSMRVVKDSFLLYQQNQMLRANANGNFADLAYQIVHDPAMLRFLNNNQNTKRKPNENLARELMELFTLGEGNYTEQDIRQGARALTGFTFWDNDFVFARRVHDQHQKTIFGESGNFDGNDFVELLLARKECPRFVAYKLYKHFVADVDDVPSPVAEKVIGALASIVRSHDYELKPVLKVLLKSRHFYNPSVIGNKIKSPIQLLAGTVRVLALPPREYRLLMHAMRLMGQVLFAPPTVAGWPGGRAWINTSTLFVRQNLTTYLINGRRSLGRGGHDGEIDYDPLEALDDLPVDRAQVLLDHLLTLLVAPKVTPQRKRQIMSALDLGRHQVGRKQVLDLMTLITSLPEYQLC